MSDLVTVWIVGTVISGAIATGCLLADMIWGRESPGPARALLLCWAWPLAVAAALPLILYYAWDVADWRNL